VITLVTPEKEKDVRKLQRELRRREPIEAATAATAAQVLAATAPKPVDRGDGLDGVSRRERARAEDTGRPRQDRPGRKPHRKGQGQPKGQVQARNGQERAGAPARSGRPSAKPGRRPAGAGAARPGRPANGNARRRSS